MSNKQFAVRTEQERGRDDTNRIFGCRFPPGVAQEIEINDIQSVAPFSFQPVHDRLGQQAGCSKRRVKLNEHRSSATNAAAQGFGRVQRRRTNMITPVKPYPKHQEQYQSR